ncbi:MAG: TGS domain-containing protein, partial [Gemmatimonadetes bacterium]|nr:TGS domain-containing protein [Gemmatimonadota bacterium]
QNEGKTFDQVMDVFGFRIIVRSVAECYHALGVAHSVYKPLDGRFRDFIAIPKANGYQSLHTVLFGPYGSPIEVQIRTEEMHRTAEYGIAAHWRYKEGEPTEEDEVDEALMWFRQVLEWQQDTKEPEEFMEFLKMDLFQGEIFLFTPKGEVKQLPVGATPIDFAFSVHTEVGFHCAGAKVNGRIAPLSRELKNGDTVEILTNPRQWPTRDWLAFVKTSRARGRIKQWIRKQEFDSAVKIGRDLLDRELKKLRKELPDAGELQNVAHGLGQSDWEHVHAALGRGDLGPTAVLKQIFPGHDPAQVEERTPTALQRLAEKLIRTNKGVRIQGMDNLMVRYSQCCQPVPGDEVIGYITRGRGVSIHRRDCPNVLSLDGDRRIDIEWAAEKGDRFMVRLFLKGTDRRGLLGDVARAITDTGTNIQHADMKADEGGMNGEFVVEVQDLPHLKKVLRSIARVKGVVSVERRESFEEADLVEM